MPKKKVSKRQPNAHSRVKKFFFIQDSGIFKQEIAVSIGHSKDEILKLAKKEKFKQEFFGVLDDSNFRTNETEGAVYFDVKTNTVWLLEMKAYEDTWEFWEILLHEIVHIVQRLRRKMWIENEDEAEAYLAEHLFHSIRRKIQIPNKSR
jgi:hypothetical protein